MEEMLPRVLVIAYIGLGLTAGAAWMVADRPESTHPGTASQ